MSGTRCAPNVRVPPRKHVRYSNVPSWGPICWPIVLADVTKVIEGVPWVATKRCKP